MLLDVARLGFDVPVVAGANYLLVWLVFHQLGFGWQDGTLAPRAAVAGAFAAGGVAVLIGLTTLGPYPVSMVGVPGADLQNTAPPTFALLVLGLTLIAGALSLDAPSNRFLRRARPWTAVVAVNSVILTMFLWHMSAAVLSAIVLYPTGILPEPAVDSAAWFGWRLPWLAFCAVVLAVLVSVFASIEARSAAWRGQLGNASVDHARRSGGRRGGRGSGPAAQAVGSAGIAERLHLPYRAWSVVIGVGIAGAVGGLVIIAIAGRDAGGPAGLPSSGLICYFAGAGLLRLARHQQPAPTR